MTSIQGQYSAQWSFCYLGKKTLLHLILIHQQGINCSVYFFYLWCHPEILGQGDHPPVFTRTRSTSSTNGLLGRDCLDGHRMWPWVDSSTRSVHGWISHPSTNYAQCCLTSLITQQLIFPSGSTAEPFNVNFQDFDQLPNLNDYSFETRTYFLIVYGF